MVKRNVLLVMGLVLMGLMNSCSLGGNQEDAGVFVPAEAKGKIEANAPVPGYESGVVPWEISALDSVVEVIVKPQPEISLENFSGKGVSAMSGIPFTTPADVSAGRSTSALATDTDAYFSQNVAPSEVLGATFWPEAGDPAYAYFELSNQGGANTLGIAWHSLPENFGGYYIGIGDQNTETWHWYHGPDDGVLTFEPQAWNPAGQLGSRVLVCVLLDSGDPADFWQLKLGVEEIRGTGLAGSVEPGPADPRASSRAASATLPAMVDLNPFNPQVRNQGSMGSCTAFACADSAFNILLNQHYGDLGWVATTNDTRTSPMYAYVRSGISPIGSWNPVCGASQGRYMSEAFNVLKNVGTCSETAAPYQATENCSTSFNNQAYEEDEYLMINSWNSISGSGDTLVNNMKAALAEGQPIVIAMYQLEYAFMNYSSGVYYYSGGSYVNGGHAMCIVGYDDSVGNNGAFDIRNSWGTYWGDDGHCWIDYNCVSTLAGLYRFSAYEMHVDFHSSTAAYFFDAAPATDESEPNNQAASANPLPQLPFDGFQGSLDSADNTDYFSFSYAEGDQTEFTLNHGLSANYDLELCEPNGSLIFGAYESGATESINGIWNDSGIALLKVSRTSGEGAYVLTSSLSVSPPVAPGNLAASDGTQETGIAISWTPVAQATSYIVERATPPAIAFVQVGTVTQAAFEDTQANPWTDYEYRVIATNTGGNGPASLTDIGWRGSAGPASVSATAFGDRVLLDWAPVMDADSYRVARAKSPYGPFTLLDSLVGLELEDTTVTAGLTYYYTVTASRGEKQSSPSYTVSAIVPMGELPTYHEEANPNAVEPEETTQQEDEIDVSGNEDTPIYRR